MREPALITLVPKLAGHRVVVLGDVILDEYLMGRATRMSREAPVPVLEFESRQLIPGGAANPAANIAALGSTAIQVGLIGGDDAAQSLRQLLESRAIGTTGLVIDAQRPTTVKTRLLAQMGLYFPQQVARLDRLSRQPVPPDIEHQVVSFIRSEVASVSALLVSDYHIGLLTPSLVNTIYGLARASNALLTADAQGELDKYAGFDLVKCNADEARAYLRRDLSGDADFWAAARELVSTLNLNRAMVITRGADGMTLAAADGTVEHCPPVSVTEVYDTVGAGDTAIAVLTLAVLAGATLSQAAALANEASGLVVRRVGNYAPTPAELAAALHN